MANLGKKGIKIPDPSPTDRLLPLQDKNVLISLVRKELGIEEEVTEAQLSLDEVITRSLEVATLYHAKHLREVAGLFSELIANSKHIAEMVNPVLKAIEDKKDPVPVLQYVMALLVSSFHGRILKLSEKEIENQLFGEEEEGKSK